MQKAKLKMRLLAIVLCMVTTITSIPLEAFADTSNNHAPVLREEYESGLLEKTITTDDYFFLNLQDVFADDDSDTLTYFVKLDNKNYRKTEYKCMYKPDSAGVVEFTFKANDGKEDSSELKVELQVVEENKAPVQLLGAEDKNANNLLSSLIIHTGASVTAKDSIVLLKNTMDSYLCDNIFDPEKIEYTLSGEIYEVKKSENDPAELITLGFRAQTTNPELTATLHWGEDSTKDILWESGISKIQQMLSAGKNEFSIVVSNKKSQSENDTVYKFSLDVFPTLYSLEAETGFYFDKTFQSTTKEYVLSVGKNVKKVKLNAVASSEDCQITYNGKKSSEVNIEDVETIEVVVSKENVANTYTIRLDKKDIYNLDIRTIPKDATVLVYDHLGNKISSDKGNVFTGMFENYEHEYVVSADGYITQSGKVPKAGGVVNVELEKVVGKQPDTDVDVEWANFRNSSDNMAITSVKTPRSEDASKVTPKWIKKLDEGSPSIQIIVDNALVVMSGKTLYKLDLETGEVLQQSEMASDTGYGYTPMTYAEGMIFCPLTNGTIQAFNAKTLESLWVYKNELGGQSLSPITYSDGYIYTGFWKGEKANANFVCISILDEDVTKKTESKKASWTHTQNGGFYWAGAVTVGDAVIVGTDDGAAEGTHANSYLYSFNKKNGEVISKITLQKAGDQRSSISYSKENGRVYFTTKGGYLYSAKVNANTGNLSNLKGENFGYMSTSTPVVYKDRVYFGVGKSLASGCISVADADSLEILFSADMKGYPQCSMLLTTAYEVSTGYLYLYSTYNNRPGGITVIKVKADCKSAKDMSVTELYDADGYSEFCITSVICDKNGTLYYKNDTGNIFAVGIPSYENVINLIEEIGQVSLESEGKIKAARASYNALSAADKQKVTNYKKLINAEKEYQQIANVNHVVELINAIGKVTLTSNEKIAAARKAYDLLTASEKVLVTNKAILTDSENQYDNLVEKAINQVENSIYDIGTVTVDSKNTITKARILYDALPSHLKDKVKNLNLLLNAEEDFKKLLEEQKNKKETIQKNEISINDLDPPTKSKVMLLQEKLESITDNISYKDAMNLMKDYMSLNEKGQLALKDMEAISILQNVISAENHKNSETGFIVEGVDWNIRLVVDNVSDEEILNEFKQKVTEYTLLDMWDITLEDCITGEKYQPQNEITIKIPLESIENQIQDNQKYTILHYTEEKQLEIFNCTIENDYLVFDAVEFSYYGILCSEKEDSDVIQDNEISEDVLSESLQGLPWYFWIGMALAGILLLALVAILMKVEAEDDEKEIESAENIEEKG